MTKKVSIKLSLAVFILSFLITSAAAASYYALFDYVENGKRMTGGITDKYYTYYTSTSSTYISAVDGGVGYWDSAISDFDFTYSPYSSSQSCALNFTASAYGSGLDWYADTDFYNSSDKLINSGDDPTTNWKYVIIKLNTSKMSADTLTYKKGTVAHEIGHAMGLAHYNKTTNGCQLMNGIHDTRYSYSVYKPQNGDIAGVEYLY